MLPKRKVNLLVRSFAMFVLLTLTISGIVPAMFHYDIYEDRKQQERMAFQEYAVPPNGEEISDNSYEKIKSIVIAKEYRVMATEEELEKYYRNKLENAGWKKVTTETGFGYSRDDFDLKIFIQIPKVKVRLLYTGKDDNI